MKQLAQHYKTAKGEKKAKIVAALKQHTARKKELEAQLDKAVAGTGADQELDTTDEALPTGFGTGQGRSKTISKGKESNPDLKATLKAKEPKKPKYIMKNGIPHKLDGTPLKRVTELRHEICMDAIHNGDINQLKRHWLLKYNEHLRHL